MTGYRIAPELSPSEQQAAPGVDAPAAVSADLTQEAQNMLELLSSLSPPVDLLSITSKAAQAVLRQF